MRLVDENLLTTMETLADVAPAHNPPYARAMRELKHAFPEIPLVAALETGFHETVAEEQPDLRDALRMEARARSAALGISRSQPPLYRRTDRRDSGPQAICKVISCHLGGSNSLCAIRDGQSLGTSMGMSPQTGLPHNNRVGDFDPFALPVLMKATGKRLGNSARGFGRK